jgi:CRP-like cAMP-binding protein
MKGLAMSIQTPLVGPYERLMLLEALSLSGHPPTDALAALAQQAAERRLAAGSTLIDDQPGSIVHIVVEGRVTVSQSERRLYSAGPHETFGLLELLGRVSCGVEVYAELETTTLDIGARTLFSILEDHPVMTLAIVQGLARALMTSPAAATDVIARSVRMPKLSSSAGFDLVDRIRLLQMSDLFSHARVDSLAEIAQQFEEFRIEPATRLWREGDSASWLLVLLDGRVDAVGGDAHCSWTPGMAPGGLEAVAGMPRWCDAVAATALTGLRLSAERLFDALEDDFSMAEDLLAALASQLRQLRYG